MQFGWLMAVASRASRKKRSTNSSLLVNSGRSVLIATARFTLRWLAR